MVGKYIPTDNSKSINAKKARAGCGWFESVAHEQMVIERVAQITAVKRIEGGRTPLLRSNVLTVEPIMMNTIKQEKISPNGQSLKDSFDSKTGVQRKRKIYMMDSNVDWTKPSRKSVLSFKIVRSPLENERLNPNSRLP